MVVGHDVAVAPNDEACAPCFGAEGLRLALASLSAAQALTLALAKLTEERSGHLIALIGDLRGPGMFNHDRYDSRADMFHKIGEAEGRGIVDLMGNRRRSS